jgi:hypothetical protein
MTDPLDRAAEALRAVPTPPGPPPALEAATVAALAAAEPVLIRRRRRMRLVRTLGATAALTAAITLAVVLGTGTPSALAAAVAKAKNAKSVKFVCTLAVKHPDFTPKVTTVYYQGSKVRIEEEGTVRIIDYAAPKALILYPEQKYAWRPVDVQKYDPPLDHFKKLVNARGQKDGTDDVAGVKADRYRITLDPKADPREYRLWLDPRTGWPVKLEGRGKADMRGYSEKEPPADYTLTQDRFEWDAPLDEKLFSLEVPPGWDVGGAPWELWRLGTKE